MPLTKTHWSNPNKSAMRAIIILKTSKWGFGPLQIVSDHDPLIMEEEEEEYNKPCNIFSEQQKHDDEQSLFSFWNDMNNSIPRSLTDTIPEQELRQAMMDLQKVINTIPSSALALSSLALVLTFVFGWIIETFVLQQETQPLQEPQTSQLGGILMFVMPIIVFYATRYWIQTRFQQCVEQCFTKTIVSTSSTAKNCVAVMRATYTKNNNECYEDYGFDEDDATTSYSYLIIEALRS